MTRRISLSRNSQGKRRNLYPKGVSRQPPTTGEDLPSQGLDNDLAASAHSPRAASQLQMQHSNTQMQPSTPPWEHGSLMSMPRNSRPGSSLLLHLPLQFLGLLFLLRLLPLTAAPGPDDTKCPAVSVLQRPFLSSIQQTHGHGERYLNPKSLSRKLPTYYFWAKVATGITRSIFRSHQHTSTRRKPPRPTLDHQSE